MVNDTNNGIGGSTFLQPFVALFKLVCLSLKQKGPKSKINTLFAYIL